MKPSVLIRSEKLEDVGLIRDIVLRAYADVPYSDHREHLMIERLRCGDSYKPGLSLIAEKDADPAGHILMTKADIVGNNAVTETLALAPLSVVPEHQSCGVGKMLVEAAHEKAADLGFGSIVLVGIPDYYTRFGYVPLSTYPIRLPFDAPQINCMVRLLRPHALDGVAGVVRYAEGWLDH